MTIPHLQNCDHCAGGWCLDCVKTLHDEKEAIRVALDKARGNARADGVTTRLFAEWCGISPTTLCEWTGGELPLSPPDFLEASGELPTGLQKRFRSK